jgi:hypothetical protein
MSTPELLSQIAGSVYALSPEKTANSVKAALGAGVEPLEIIDQGIVRGMEMVGEEYRNENMFLPELLVAEQCMRSGLAEIETFVGLEGAPLVAAARQRLAERAASWLPALSSCVTRLLHSSDSLLTAKQK